MTGFKLHKRGNPCPVCHGIKDCKSSLSSKLVLCHTHVDYDPDIAGWNYRGNSIGVWGQFFPDEGKEGTFDREAWLRQKEEDQRRQKAARKNALGRDGRDNAIRQLHKHIGLSTPDRDRLRNRGLTDDQIEKYQFFSKNGYQDIPKGIPINLPGVYKTGRTLGSKYSGIVCPAFDYQGRAIGWQTRKHHAEENKYIWAVSYHPGTKISSHLPNGELPITLVQENPDSKTLYLTEGLLKPIVAGCNHKLNIAGCPTNGNFHLASQQLGEILSLGYNKLIIIPDAGDVINPKVMERWHKQVNFFRSFKVSVAIAWWGQITKKSGDIDEIKNLDDVETITPEDFFELGKKFKDATWKSWFNSEDFSAQDCFHKPYVDYSTPPKNSIFALKSDMGTGKTTTLVKWIKELEKDRGIISLGYRNGLLYQFCDRTKFDHIHEKQALNMLGYHKATIALCVDSLPKFQPEDFDNKVIILDECTSIIRHLLLSSTTAKNREKIFYLFGEAIKRSDRVILLDGNMTDWAVNFIASFSPEKQVIKIENNYKANEGRTVLFCDGTVTSTGKINQRNSSGIKQRILNAPRPFIAIDSQIQAEAFDILLSSQGYSVLRIDSTTSHTKAAQEFLADCNNYISKHQPDAVIITPSAESGVDVSIEDYFTHNFLVCCGAVGVPALMQLGTRLRDKSAQMVVWAGKHNSAQKLSPEIIVDEIILYIKAHDLLEIDDRNEQTIRQALMKSVVRDQESLVGKLKTFLAFEKANLSEALQMSFTRKGWEIEQTVDSNSTSINKLFRETKVEIQKERAVAIFNAKDISASNLNYNAKFDATPDEIYARHKARLKSLLPGIELTDIWSEEFIFQVQFKHPDFLNKINTRYLFDHPEIAKQLNTKAFAKEYIKAGIVENMSLMNIRARGSLALALRETGIDQILNAPEGTEYHTKSTEIIDIHNKLKRSPKLRNKVEIKNLSKYPMHNVNRLLALVNKKLEVSEIRRIPGQRHLHPLKYRVLVDINLDKNTNQTCYNLTCDRWKLWLNKEMQNLASEIEKNEKKVAYSDIAQMLNLSRLVAVKQAYEINNKITPTLETKSCLGEFSDKIRRTIQKIRVRIHQTGFQDERKLLIDTRENYIDGFNIAIDILLQAGWQEFCKIIQDWGDFKAYQLLSILQFYE